MRNCTMRQLSFTLFLLILFILTACQSPPATPTPAPLPVTETPKPSPEEPVELVIWSEFFTYEAITTDPEGAGLYGAYLIEKFEEEHPGVTVRLEYHGWDETLRQNLFNALLAGTPPDIVVGENFFQQYAELGALVPLDDVVADIQDDLIPGTYKAAEYDGHIYGISALTGIFAFERT